MRDFDEYGLSMCRYQGELFAESLKYVACSTPVFLRRFMYSQTAARMDGNGFMFESLSVEDAIAEIEREFGKSGYGKSNTAEKNFTGSAIFTATGHIPKEQAAKTFTNW